MSDAVLTLTAFVVHRDAGAVAPFIKALAPGVSVTSYDHAPSLQSAFQVLLQSSFDVCFIQSALSEGLEAFFHDMQLIESNQDCIFVQVVAKHGDIEEQIPPHAGFAGRISEAVTAADRQVMTEAFQSKAHRQEVVERTADVDDALEVLLRKVDAVAADRQRGRMTTFDRAVSGFVEDQLKFDQKILGGYLDSLADKSEVSAPPPAKTIEVPERVLKRRLPHLTQTGYSGASSRVWKKLVQKFGKGEGAEAGGVKEEDEGGEKKS